MQCRLACTPAGGYPQMRSQLPCSQSWSSPSWALSVVDRRAAHQSISAQLARVARMAMTTEHGGAWVSLVWLSSDKQRELEPTASLHALLVTAISSCRPNATPFSDCSRLPTPLGLALNRPSSAPSSE
eukprot:scaffold225_cov388-Prasinococcus_capsulatus_cf.AAC.11